MAYFPIFIELVGKKVLVAGGGRIAARRAGILLDFGACVTVVSPELSGEMRTLIDGAADGGIVWLAGEYGGGDLKGYDLVLAATDRREVNHQAYLDALAAGLPVNVCDKKEECSFYFPGIAKSGCVVAGITAGGNDHGLARKMTESVRELFRKEGEGHGRSGMEDREQGKPSGGRADKAGDGTAEEGISGCRAGTHNHENGRR